MLHTLGERLDELEVGAAHGALLVSVVRRTELSLLPDADVLGFAFPSATTPPGAPRRSPLLRLCRCARHRAGADGLAPSHDALRYESLERPSHVRSALAEYLRQTGFSEEPTDDDCVRSSGY